MKWKIVGCWHDHAPGSCGWRDASFPETSRDVWESFIECPLRPQQMFTVKNLRRLFCKGTELVVPPICSTPVPQCCSVTIVLFRVVSP